MVDIICCQLVCKRWRSLIKAPSFKSTSHELCNRHAWFYMLNSQSPANVVYDLEINNWRHFRLPVPIDFDGTPTSPVASSDGLMCFISKTGWLIVCNPITGSARSLTQLDIHHDIRLIAMHTMGSSYKVFVIFWHVYDFFVNTFSSVDNTWTLLPVSSVRMITSNANVEAGIEMVSQRVWYVEWTPKKEMEGLTMIDSNDQVMVYYLNQRGKLVRFDLLQGTAMIYPPLMPFRDEDSIDLVKCAGRILVITVIREPLGNETLEIFEFDHVKCQWSHVAAMPPEMFLVYPGLGKIRCAGHDDCVVCVVSSDITRVYRVVMYNILKDTWIDLPMCFDLHGEHAEMFVATYSFKPDKTASV